MRADMACGQADDRADLATDWYPGGITGEDAIEIARALSAAGADAIDVSTGQVTPDEEPAFGRSYQTPFADAIRNRTGIATIAVGVISSYDDVNSIILACLRPTCARWAGPTSTTRTGPCTPPRSRATMARLRPGPIRGGPGAGRRRPAAPTARGRGCS